MKTGSLYFVLLLLIAFNARAQADNPSFSQNQVEADLAYLYDALKEAHYNLFAYAGEKEAEAAFRNARASLSKDSLSLLEATNLLQRFVATFRNGHTEIDFPAASYRDYAFSGGTLFPLELAFEEGKSLVRKNYSGNGAIPIGSEVVRINGAPISEILSGIYPQVSAERPYFRDARIEMYSFPRLYWQVYGPQDAFNVQIRTQGSDTTVTLPAVDLIEGYEMKRDEVLNASLKLEFIGPAAVLNPGNFGGDEMKYRQFVDSAFAAIARQGSKHLVIDLRNNPGGNDSFSDYLVSYLADQPFRWNARFSLKSSRLLKEHTRQHNDTTTAYSQSILHHKNGETYPFDFGLQSPKPEAQRYKGQVYVLVNRQTYSQAAVTAAQIQDYGFGTLVGEETGEYPTLYASQFQFTLPHTGIGVRVSKGYIVRVNGREEKEGVIPDLIIKDHLLDEKDEIMEGVLQKIDQDGY